MAVVKQQTEAITMTLQLIWKPQETCIIILVKYGLIGGIAELFPKVFSEMQVFGQQVAIK